MSLLGRLVLNDGTCLLVGDYDPSATGTDAPQGSLFLRKGGTNALYQKTGAAATAWGLFTNISPPPMPVLTTVEVDFGAAGLTAGTFTIAGVGLTVGKPVFIQQAAAAYTGKGTSTDESGMDQISVNAVVETATLIRCYYQSPGRVLNKVKFSYFIGG